VTLREAALAYARHGLAVFPLQPRAKRPVPGSHGVHDASRDEAIIEKWWTDEPNANIGIACGRPSGVVVFDVDGEMGAESLAALNLALPLTPAVSTGRGTHIYFQLPSEPLGNRAGMSPGLDFRADGGYVVAPPSIHPDGHLYEWAVDYTVPFAKIPAEILEMAQRSVSVSQTLEGPIPKGKRNDTAFRQASAMRRLGMDEETIFTALRADKRYDPPLSDFELGRIAKNAARYEPDATVEGNEKFQARIKAKAAAQQPTPASELDPDYVPGTRMSDVQREHTRWLWYPYFPAGKLVILDGDPGLGKSTLLLDLAARWSRGMPNPDKSMNQWGQEFNTVVISVEDSLGETIQPRLHAQGADMGRIVAIEDIRPTPGEEFGVEIVKHMPYIRRTIEQEQARFMIVDPLMAVLDETVDTHRDQAIRSQVMAPLRKLAEETGCTIAFVRHFNKLSGNAAIYRGGGSIGIIGATRSAMIVAKNPIDPEGSRIFAHAKSNLARSGKSWVYHIEDSEDVGVFRWDGESDMTADQLVMDDLRDAPKRAEAVQFLRDMLVNGPMTVSELEAAAKADGITPTTLHAAATKMAEAGALVRSGGGNFGGPKVWALKGMEVDV